MKKLLLIAAVALTAAACSPKDDAPDGSELNPFIVDSEAALRKVGTGTDGWELDKHYRQTKNITLSTPWTCIGTDATRFNGTYDGGGFSISNLTISEATSNHQGLFGYIGNGGKVRNIALKNATLNCTINYVGGIAGTSIGSIENCYVTGTISAYAYAGGVVGENGHQSIIKNCYTTCNVTSSSRAGGITSENRGSIENCYATGKITAGSLQVGGIVGLVNPNSTVKQCVALNKEVVASAGNVGNVGRIAGRIDTGDPAILQNNFARESGMVLRAGSVNVSPTEATASGKDGADVFAINTHGANSDNWWTLSSTTSWSYEKHRLPHLLTTTGKEFDEPQNPTVL